MAKQTGPHFISGTIAGITYYRSLGQWLARTKSSLNKARISTDPAFANSRIQAALFGKAAAIAAKFYYKLPASARRRGAFGRLTAKIKMMLMDGLTEDDIGAAFK